MVFAKRLTDGALNDNKLFAQKEFKKPSFLKRFDEDCTTETIEVWEDWYNISSDGTWYLHHSTFKGYETTVSCQGTWLPDLDIRGGGGAGIYVNRSGVAGVYRACGGPHCQFEIEDVFIPPVQIINNLTPKTKCVYTNLNNSSTNFADAIKKFDGEFPVSHLRFENSTTLPSDVNAETSPPDNYLITIKINSNNLSRPNLSIARTIIHETIHAEMFRKILSILDNGGDLDGLTAAQWTQKLSNGDYPGIFDYYSRYGVNGMQHEQMAAHYISTISDTLEEFQSGLSQDTYDALAWVGLKDTTAWNNLTTAEKSAINDIITDFDNLGIETCN